MLNLTVVFTFSVFDLQVLTKKPFGILMLPDYLPAGYSQRLEGSSNYCFNLDVSLFIEQQRILLLS